jgi:hypothetical protein
MDTDPLFRNDHMAEQPTDYMPTLKDPDFRAAG